jgi:hypothetical protein
MPQSKTQFEVEIIGLDALRMKLREGRFLSPTRDFLKELGRVAQKTAQRAAKPHPADKGTLGRAILLDFALDGSSARVAPAPAYRGIAFTIEEGRRPGRRPPHGPIKRWMISHGIIPEGRGKGISQRVKDLREEIKLHGTRGVHFMAQAEKAVNKAMHEGIPKTEQEIKALWDRG